MIWSEDVLQKSEMEKLNFVVDLTQSEDSKLIIVPTLDIAQEFNLFLIWQLIWSAWDFPCAKAS